MDTSSTSQKNWKKLIASVIAVVFALGLMFPISAIAVAEQGENVAGNCTVTLEYYENVYYEDPDVVPDEDGRSLLGTYTLTGLSAGDVIDTWDYVVDIPGHFFFDAWPGSLTVSEDPSQNVIQLFYFKTQDAEYTVNYYVMTGADLTANNWSDALRTGTVEFTKIASEKFENQRFNELVQGDAFEYKVDGLYVINTYPEEIRLGVDPDNNVINVLYTPDSVHLPDDVEIDEKPPADDEFGGTDDTLFPTLPGDSEFTEGDLTDLLPDDEEVIEDFIGGDDTIEITDEMIANPMDKEDIHLVSQAYQVGKYQGSALSQTGDQTLMTVSLFTALIAVVVACVSLFMWRKHKGSARE